MQHDLDPMQEIELAMPADDGTMFAGMLALPSEGAGPPYPAAVMLWPGKFDRAGNMRNAPLELGRPLAAALARRGVASYRFDRRGVGATPGDWRATGFIQHRLDAAAILRGLATRPEIATVAAIGYSEGALHAAWLAAHAAPPCAAAVLLGCPAQDGEAFYLAWAARLGKDQIPWWMHLVMRPLGKNPSEQVATLINRIKRTTRDVERVYGFKLPARAMREYLAYDPKPDLAQIAIPVLAITGSNDFSIEARDLQTIAGLVKGEVNTLSPAGLTHALRRDPRPASAQSYREQYRQPVDPQLLEDVAGWLAERLGGAKGATTS